MKSRRIYFRRKKVKKKEREGEKEIMGQSNASSEPLKKYDIVHFEALGREAEHLPIATAQEQEKNALPKDLKSLVVPETIQEFLEKNPGFVLPDIITIKTHSLIPEDYVKGLRKSIVTRTSGFDHCEEFVDVANITTLRDYCVGSVAQTAIKFLYAAAGFLNHYTENTRIFERNRTVSFIELNSDRVATLFGAGKIGKTICGLLRGNGLTAQYVDVGRTGTDEHGVRFVSKEEAIRNSDIIINTMPLSRDPASKFYNVDYFSKDYLSRAKPGLIFINVTRGEIAPEAVLLELYDAGIISGIGVDVYSEENVFRQVINGEPTDNPNHLAAKEMITRSLNRTANIYVQPHQAFNSDVASIKKAYETLEHVAAWYKNDKKRFNYQLPY
jgi:D-lactate dehydrogenase